MARNSKKSNNAKKSSLKKVFYLIIVIVLIIVAEHTIINNGDTAKTKQSILNIILEFFEIDIDLNENTASQDNEVKNAENEAFEDNNTSEKNNIDKIEAGNNSFDDSKLEIYFFDVGQADSILLLTDNKSMLIDTGNAGDATEKNTLTKDNINLTYELKRLGIEFIDILVATHPHEDHMGSMYKIINAFDIGDLYANNFGKDEIDKRYYDKFEEAMIAKNVHLVAPTTLTEKEIKAKIQEYNATLSPEEEKVVYDEKDYIRVGDIVNFGDAKLTLIAPNSAEYSDTNDYSLVFMLEFEGVKVLLTGDAGKESEEEMINYARNTGFDLDCDVLKVGHHGSRTANTEEFIAMVKPEYSVIMVEEGNSYGLPDEDVIERLERHGSKIYYTMNEGDIKLIIDDGEYKFDFSYQHEEK